MIPDILWCDVDVPEDAIIQIDGDPFQVQPFKIAKYLVTYEQFQAFVEHPNGFENPDWWRDMPEKYQKQSLDDPRQPYTNYPRDSVSWYQAVAYARWLDASYREAGLMTQIVAHLPFALREKGLGDEGKWQIRLPTEWEWQWAAQNGAEVRQYPWEGGEWDGRLCNTSEAGVGRTTAVGMYPHGAASCGALDMAGNLREWCQNDHGDPTVVDGFGNGNSKVLRGGSFYHDRRLAAAAYRYSRYNPNNDGSSSGFRLVVVLRSPY